MPKTIKVTLRSCFADAEAKRQGSKTPEACFFEIRSDLEGDQLYEFLFEQQNDSGTPKLISEYPSMTAGDMLTVEIDGQQTHVLCSCVGFREVDDEFLVAWEKASSLDRNQMARF